jgi:hypothetical protein
MFEAYSVAVKVTLINGVTNGLMNIARGLVTTDEKAKALQATVAGIQSKMLIGGALTATGLFGLNLIDKTMPAAKEYARQLALMNTLGMRQAEIAKTVGQAWKTTYDVPTTTAAHNLATFRELRSAFGSDTVGQAHAADMLPVVGRLEGLMQSMTGKAQEHVGFDMVKAIELRTGTMTPEALQRNADLMSRAIIGMGGSISVSDFHGALKMGRMATNKWSDDFTYDYLPTLMQEMKTGQGGAQTAGRAVLALYNQMHGRMTKAAMPLWVEGGLLKPSDVVKNATGNYQVKPGAVAGTELFETNPFLWVQQYLRPAIARIVATHKGMSDETAINAMYSNQMAAFGAYNMYVKAGQYERDKTTIGKADGGYTAYQKLLKTDPTLASQALHAQWQNILAQIGYSIMPTLISGTLKLVVALKGLGQEMHAHPTAVRILTTAFAGLSAVLLFAGTVLLLQAAFSAVGLAFGVMMGAAVAFGGAMTTVGAIVAGVAWPLTLVVAAATGLGVAIWQIVKHWDASKGIIANIKGEFGMFFDWLINQVRKLPGLHDFGKPKAATEAYRAPFAPPGWHPFAGAFGGGHPASPYVAPRAAPTKSSAPVGVFLDGRLVGHAVMPHMADAMDRSANVGASEFDPRMTLSPVAWRG